MANVDDAPPVGSWRKSVYPVYIEAQAGIGSKPISLFSIGDDKDRALAWVKTIKNAVPAIALLFGMAINAVAGIPTPNLGLNKWAKGDLASDYLPKQNADQDTLDAAICDKRGSCVIAGDLNVLGTIISTNTGTLGGGGSVGFVQDDLISTVNGSTKAFVLSNTPAATSLIVLVRNGLVQKAPQDFTLVANKVYTVVAPSVLTSSFFIQYSTVASGGGGGTSSGTVVAQFPILGIGSIGNPLRLDPSSVTLLGPTIDVGELSFVPATSFDLAIIGASTASLQTQINAGIPSSIVVDAPLLGNGTGGSHLRVDGTSVTLAGNNFNTNSGLTKLDASGNLILSNGNYTATHSAPHFAPILNLSANTNGDAVQIINSNATTGTGMIIKTGLDANYTMLMTNAASDSQHAFFGNGKVRLNMQGTSQVVSVEGTGGLNLTQGPITANGPNGNIVSGASVTASGFFGNGSKLTNLYNIDRSSSLVAFNTTNTAYVTVLGSTVTLTGVASGNRVRAYVNIAFSNSANNQLNSVGVMVNGSVLATLCEFTQNGANNVTTCSGDAISLPTGGGVVSAAVVVKVSGGTLTMSTTTGVRTIIEELK